MSQTTIGQTPKESIQEAVTNTVIAFGISTAGHFFFVLPATAYYANCTFTTAEKFHIAVGTTIFYTIVSVLRNYIIRRWFNKRSITKS